MLSGRMVEKYSDLEAWFHDYFVAERALNLQFYVLKQSKLAGILAENRARQVLDLGCGGGQAVLRLKEHYPHLQLTGIDLSETLIERAQARAQHQGGAVQFAVANAQALPFADESFDVVYSFGSVKHWPEPLKGIAECWRVLKAGGELLLTDNISDATREQFVSFYNLAHFPKRLEKPVVALIARFMTRHARPLAVYQHIAAQLHMPSGTVTQPSYLPAFLLRTQKPALTMPLPSA
jgi:ubiquinone/menaquinone biosynthesis C-methylase UbiE